MRAFAVAAVPEPKATGWALLTPRQCEVMRWVKLGKTTWATAKILECSENTVKKLLQQIYQRLNVENRMEAANALPNDSEAEGD